MKPKKLTDLKNISPKLAVRLNEIGVYTETDLRSIGPVQAHQLIKARYPELFLSVSYYLYSFEGALTGKYCNDIGDERKKQLCTELGL